jgi:zinc transport system ATP-binding protein
MSTDATSDTSATAATDAPAAVVTGADADEELLRCAGLVIGHRGRPLLPPIDLGIRRGRVLAVLGRNGAGKSTFVNTLLGFLPAVAGQLHRAHPAPRMAYMVQAATLDPTVPVRAREVAAWGGLRGWSFLLPRNRQGLRAAARAGLAAADAGPLADAFVRDLSEGQRQRVLLARLLAAAGDVMVLDEPTAAMDAVAEQNTMALLRSWSRDRGMAVVLITHLLGLVRRYADEALYLDRDDGVAVAGTPAEIFRHPTFRRQYGEIDVHGDRDRDRDDGVDGEPG